MSEFILHTLDTAPQASRKLLQNAEQQMGFIPNLFSVMAESPAVLETYLTLTYLRSFYWRKSLIYGFRLILTQKFPLKSMVFF